ncbi:hypothetical protein DFH28DRAFT_1170063 [Melampsora americana]|nr:hypothetical protein DFH28DRAFT_1170063 [Melampsora americana]
MANIPQQAPLNDPYISIVPNSQPTQYTCSVCNSRSMMTYSQHVQSAAHTTAVANFIAQQEADEEMSLAIQLANHPATPKFQEDIVIQSQASISPIDSPIFPPSPLTFLQTFDLLEKIQSNSEESDGKIDIKSLSCALEALAHDQDTDEDDLDEEPPDKNTQGTREESNVWYPFKKKEYQRIWSILRICAVNLPGWGSLRDLSIHMKTNLGFNVIERLSPSGTPLFGLEIKRIIKNELANSLVSPHLVFVPELCPNTKINRLSQSKKWRELYSRDQRVQMISARNNHYYIYEPLQLRSNQLVVPVFFYQQDNKVMAKCLPAEVQPDIGEPEHYNIIIPEEPSFDSCKHKGLHPVYIPIINPWREKAEGKVIRHVPITLYSDDTSGNVSKSWTKHMSIFFTLAGLSPESSNQEFNIHFLATSSVASALELLDEVVDNLNLGEEVLVVPVVLCHLGNSPMHAEICNTTNPANTLTPCWICELKVACQVDKKDDPFVRDFLGIHNLGERIRLPDHNWDVTRSRTKEIWTLVKDTNTKSCVEDKYQEYGLQDGILDYFFNKVQKAQILLLGNELYKITQQLDDDLGQHVFNQMLRLNGGKSFTNHQSPGKDIANDFNTYQIMQLLMLGGSFIDQSLQERVARGKLLTDLFQRIPELYSAMGIKRPTKKELPFIPGSIQSQKRTGHYPYAWRVSMRKN